MDSSLEKLLLKPLAALAIIGIFLWFVIKILAWIERKYNKSSFFPYAKKTSFFSVTEKNFYDALLEAVGPEFLVFAKCGVADLLEVDFQKHFRAFNRIQYFRLNGAPPPAQNIFLPGQPVPQQLMKKGTPQKGL